MARPARLSLLTAACIGWGCCPCSRPPTAAACRLPPRAAGGDLKALLLRQMATPFSPVYSKPDALRWATHVAEALHYLHAVCKPMIIHRWVGGCA
jgi:hypothetical protein